MAVSISQSLPAICQHCEFEQTEDVWVLVSSVDRPDILQQIAEGRYPAFTCNRCGRLSAIDTPLLIHRPEQGGLAGLIAAPAYAMTEEEFRQLFDGLVALLFANLNVSGQGVAVPIFPVPRLALPAILARDVRRDMLLAPDQLDPPIEAAETYRNLIAHLARTAGGAGSS